MDDILFFDFNQKSSVLLIFFFNMIVFSILLYKKGLSENSSSDKWLAGFILLCALYICPFMLGYAGWYSIKSYREFMFFTPFQHLFLIGPIFLFYLKALLDGNQSYNRRVFLHFLPATVYLIYSIIMFITDKFILNEFFFYSDGRDRDLDLWYQVVGFLSMLLYFFYGLKYYQDYRKLSLEELSFADEIAFKWVKRFMIAFCLILVLRILFFIINPEWWEFGRKFWYYLCFSIMVMYISIKGYANSNKSYPPFTPSSFSILRSSKNIEENTGESYFEENVLLNEWSKKINLLFEAENIYQNPNLTLSEIAELLGTNRNVISKAINFSFKMNFNDYVNQKRVEAIVEKLKKEEHKKATLLGIALDCGFNSKTTFNRAFKKYKGLSPYQFILKNKL